MPVYMLGPGIYNLTSSPIKRVNVFPKSNLHHMNTACDEVPTLQDYLECCK